MAKEYHLTPGRKISNSIVKLMTRFDKGPAWKLTTTGRKSGERRDVMVTPVTVDGTEYLVSPYGAVAWALNLRASDRSTLSRGNTTSRVRAVEVDGQEAGKVLAKYYHENRKYVADYFDLAKDATIVDFTRVADQHPVFRVEHPM
ncbi:MAG: nitroreductase family deazaflavin-dependent oxidoreductase [Actinomycetota bacterium]